MTTQDILNEKEALRNEYLNRGGLPELFEKFIGVLIQSNEFGLNEDWVENPMGLLGQYLNDRFMGKKEKFDIREVVGKREDPDGDKAYSFLDKKYI